MQTILSVQDMTFNFPTEDIFDGISFNVYEKDRLAIIGHNGCGKTTLIKLILGQENPNKGNIALSKSISVGYLSQEVISDINHTLYEEALLVFEDTIKLGKELEKMELEITKNPSDYHLIEEYGKKQHKFQINNGYDYPYLIDMMLTKFGFKKEEFSRPISSFSGGEKTKMSFVKLLLTKPDLLILDEPTNHLDLSTIEWLETFLLSYEGTIIFVSHDRYFINSLANKIVEIENHQITQYKGNYDFYIQEKRIRYENQLKQFNIQQKEIARMQRFIEYFRYKPRFVSRVHDREKKLEHMKKIDKPLGEEKAISIHFKGESLEGKKIIGFENVSIGYSIDQPLVNDINALVLGKDRLAIMGDNGTGKTTLLKCIMQEMKVLSGHIEYYRYSKIGYIDQHHLDINGSQTLVEEMMNSFPSMGEKAIYNHLGKFNFHDDDFFKTLDMLSGGEKMRLLLAKIILKEYDVLLLDEPTNHLDLLTKQALIKALDEYEGTIIFVSHDRFFVDEIANKVLYFTNHCSYYHDGNYQTFKELEKQLFNCEIVQDKKQPPVIKEKKNYISTSKLEEKIKRLEKRIKELIESQFLEEVYTDSKKMKEIDLEIENSKKELESLEEEYILRG
ncbi:MAG: ABC-F family ATP-binding cassette domain-containing protein [Bacillales bacterium]|nr:ABC-F family ATP-binding cassette domain-containing protein [Bacillales bacterium]